MKNPGHAAVFAHDCADERAFNASVTVLLRDTCQGERCAKWPVHGRSR
jgi:hypothetical protein